MIDLLNSAIIIPQTTTAWKVSKYGVISSPYFPVFGLETEIYFVNLRIQSECRKIRTRNNSVFGHFTQWTLLRWLTFLLGFLTVTLTVLLLSIYVFLLTHCSTVAYLPLENSDLVVVSVSIDFPLNSKKYSHFHRATYEYSRVDWGGNYGYLIDVPCSVLPLLVLNFVSRSRLELMYNFHKVNITSSLIHLQSFQLLLVLP